MRIKGYVSFLLLLLSFVTPPVFSSNLVATDQPEMGSGEGEDCQGIRCLRPIADYIKRFAASFGFNISSEPNPDIQATLLEREPSSLEFLQASTVLTQLGAIPVPITTDQNGVRKALLISNEDENSMANKQAGSTIYQYNGQGVYVSLPSNPKSNQPPLQIDPVNQSLMNLISTQPLCARIKVEGSKNEYKKLDENCLDRKDMIDQVLLPESMDIYYKNNENINPLLFSKELNSNSLFTPLLLSVEEKNTSSNNKKGVTKDMEEIEKTSPAQQASAFIQYVAGTLIPLDMPNAASLIKGSEHLTEIKAYTAMIRTYAARTSVGLANLYDILSKRLPQEVPLPKTANTEGGKTETSQALMEYKMATWRLFNTETNPSASQWIEKINKASPATIQKEMAMLLAEINYQLYLSRQQQERLLMTNSVLLFITSNATPPTTRDIDKVLGTAQ